LHRILIIGTGSIGERHLRCFQATGRAEVGMCELNEKLRTDVAARYSVKEVFASLDDALKSKWDAAMVATPANTHIPIASMLADRGINLFIEKPLSTTTDGISELIEKVNAKKLVASVAYVYRAHPALTSMREAIRSGRFGRPVQVVAVCGQNFPFYRPAYKTIYYAKRALGGGAIQDALTHIINACEWVVGPISRLAADAAHQMLEGVDVEDTAHVIARHGNVLASYSLNQYQPPNEIYITVNCEKGTAKFDLVENRWRWMTEPAGAWHNEEFPKMERDDWFIKQEHAYLDALEGKRPVLCTIEEALQTLKVNIAALASADTGAGMKNI
jgi:predicted dehydrogenase